VADSAAVKFIDEADFGEAPVVDAEAPASGNSATDDCTLELLGT
jgi:hypothetical protein